MMEKSDLTERLAGKNLVVFDGECVLCSGFFRFLVWADRDQHLHFALAQSEFGEALYDHYGLKADDYDTNLVIIDGKLHERLHGVFMCMKVLGWPWRALCVFAKLPDVFLDWLYYKVARNRYRLFGRRDGCLVPSGDVMERFVDV